MGHLEYAPSDKVAGLPSPGEMLRSPLAPLEPVNTFSCHQSGSCVPHSSITLFPTTPPGVAPPPLLGGGGATPGGVGSEAKGLVVHRSSRPINLHLWSPVPNQDLDHPREEKPMRNRPTIIVSSGGLRFMSYLESLTFPPGLIGGSIGAYGPYVSSLSPIRSHLR